MLEDNLLECKFRIFLSADIVGSTAYKAKYNSSYGWIKVFANFQEDFETIFKKELNKAKKEKKFSVDTVNNPQLWKSLGDELIYVFEIANHLEAQFYTYCFKQSVEYYSNELKSSNNLALKGTAWTAGFPVGNHETSSNDYIGPNMDIGFRISKMATTYKFILSVELALLLAQNPESCFEFFMDDPIILKGVLNDKPYPIIWIKCADKEKEQEYKLLRKYQEDCPDHAIKDYCKFYLKNNQRPLMIPFFANGKDHIFAQKPSWYDEELKALRDTLEDKEDTFRVEDINPDECRAD